MTWHATYPIITWIWDSCGGARCRGVLSGKELHRTVFDHIRARCHVGVSVKTTNLEKWFPPWTVTRSAVLFSEHGVQLVHHYRLFGDCVAHASLRGSFMIELVYFTSQAALRSGGRPSVAGIRVLGPVHHRIDRLSHTVVLRTTRRTMILWLESCSGRDIRYARRVIGGQNLGSSFHHAVQCSVVTGDVPISIRPAATAPGGVAATTALRHSGCRTGYRTVTLGRDPAVPFVTRVPSVDPLL